jgi:hypothetical protein
VIDLAALCGAFSVAAQDIEYVEVYTLDEGTTIEYFVSSLSFTRVAESVGVRTRRGVQPMRCID